MMFNIFIIVDIRYGHADEMVFAAVARHNYGITRRDANPQAAGINVVYYSAG